MKKRLFFCAGLVWLLAGCTIRREVIQPSGYNFSQDILRLVPRETIDKVRELGVPVYEGRTPPNVEGIYSIAPVYMTKSTVPNEPIKPDGFTDERLRIYNQNTTNLTASLDKKSINANNGATVGTATGQGTYLAGNGSFFSLFVILDNTRTSTGTRSRTLELYSGELTTTGIRGMQSTLLMLDDYGDPKGEYIPVNTGRAFKDNDGFSERISSFRRPAPLDPTNVQVPALPNQQ
ncbi:hypothetical protein [uncultured Spirosoma sp.]|uniref:hypothetical protein n=1 Tax=uncultured Spirosoma sp. TaxID=278208 RepID=UPI002586EC1F|nr:hypothetical protein [uncultured Spirosoma sp.]